MSLYSSLRRRRLAAIGGAVPPFLVFGNTDYPARTTASNAPNSRRLAMIGDSRVAGDQPGQFAAEVLWACGEWIWGDFRNYNHGVGGSTIYNAANTQAPAAVADGANVFVVLTGTNGARAAGEGDGVDNLENRKTETLNVLSALDQVDAVIFLCNEIPGQSDGGTGTGTQQIKVDHHDWIDGLTTVSAGLSNADLVVVDTWSVTGDGAGGISENLNTQWRNDGLHPAFQGQGRMARAIWSAMNTHFGTDVDLDFSAPSENLMDGTTTRTVNRGVVPNSWNDFSAADDLSYATSGTGLDTVVTVTNSGASTLVMNCRMTVGAVTDGVLLLEYRYDADDDASDATGSERNFAQRISVRNFDFGTGSNIANTNSPSNSAIASSQDYQMGGSRRSALYIGESGPSGRRLDLLLEVAPGQTITFHRAEIHERT